MAYALGLDASTQSLTGIIIDVEKGTVVAESSVNFGARLPQYASPSGFIPGGAKGEVHANPLMWLDALELLLADLKAIFDLSKIGAISGAGQQHGSVYLKASWFDRVGALSPEATLSEQLAGTLSRVTSPIWMDNSTTEACREIADTVGGNKVVCEKSGSVAIERFTGPQIRRFYTSAPEAYAQTKRIHLVSSFLCSVLVGRDAPIDTGDGAGMNLLNLKDWTWDADLRDATAPGLGEKLPEVKGGDAVVGLISTYFVSKYGFDASVPVTIFTGDNPSSLIGMGASEPGKIVVSLGTSDTFFAAMPEVVSDPTGCGHVFGNPRGGSMSLQCFANGSLAREAVKERFGYGWEQFTKAILDTPPGNDGNLMVPFFGPEISPRLTLEKPLLSGGVAFAKWEEPSAAIRACVEGQILNMKLQSAWMKLTPQVIYLTGGASTNDAIARIVANVFQAKVARLSTSSSVALGAAMRAAVVSLGCAYSELEAAFCAPVDSSVVMPDAATQAVYESLGHAFAKLLKA